MNFSHLHVHTRYSFLDGLNSSDELAEKAAELGHEALAITDHSSIGGWIQHQKACVKYNIKPIFGVEGYFVDDVSKRDKREQKYHITLLAKNDNGLKNMFKLLTKSHDHFYYTNRIDLDMLLETKDIIVMSACGYKGIIQHPNYIRICAMLWDKFADDFILEVMPLNEEFQKIVNNRVIGLAECGYKFVATNDVHYRDKHDWKNHQFLLRMHTGGRLGTDKARGFHVRSGEEMKEVFMALKYHMSEKFVDEAIENTHMVVDKCSATLEKQDIILPHISSTPDADIANAAVDAMLKMIPAEKQGEYTQRLNMELDVIRRKGFARYFLLVKSICDEARRRGFEMSTGRGSSAGSLLCYFLGITQVDPLEYGLLFERFLNSDRSDWPDIDIDFEDDRREELVQWAKDTYGEDKVANISTYSELKCKSAIQDVAKSAEFNIPHKDIIKVSKYLDNDMTVRECMKDNVYVKEAIKSLPNWEEVVRYTDAITGCYRQPGKHAAGIVVSPKPLNEMAVMEKRGDERLVNWGMDEAAYVGLVKIDFLGLRTLSIITEAKRLIRERKGHTLRWEEIDIHVPELFKAFGRGETVGCMQFESNLQQYLMRELAPITSIDDLVHSNALGRPGPLDSGMKDKYVQRKRGEKTKDAPYDEYIRDICKETYGVIIFQEQIIKILTDLAGYTIPQADIVRSIIAKKKSLEEFESHRDEFIEGCKKTSGMDTRISSLLFNDLQNYSRYSFNKAHATVYSLTALRQMWLKHHYPVEYMAALLRKTDDKEKVKLYINECRRMKIAILPVDVNYSGDTFEIVDDKIAIGIGSIKGIGPQASKRLVEQRKNGPYKSIEDFRIRNSNSQVNRAVLSHLVLAGAFDSLGINHKVAVNNMDWLESRAGNIGQESLFDTTPKYLYSSEHDLTPDEKSQNQMLLLDGVVEPDINPGCDINTLSLRMITDHIKQCTECELHKFYKCPVPFEHYDTSKIMVVGEAPGHEEVKEGRPFWGKAGQLLIKAFAAMGFEREDLYITNVYKCRPFNNKLPPNVSNTCHKILTMEITNVKPRLIVAFGNIPKGYFTGEPTGIMKMNGTYEAININGRMYPVFYIVHPASCFRGNDNRRKFGEAFNKLNRLIKK